MRTAITTAATRVSAITTAHTARIVPRVRLSAPCNGHIPTFQHAITPCRVKAVECLGILKKRPSPWHAPADNDADAIDGVFVPRRPSARRGGGLDRLPAQSRHR
jgi:hypothetical protein